jgi:DNA (cytosine-5)-methyltransferase 1
VEGRGLIVDLFAGGGGASTGMEAATGRPVDVAINHSPTALAVHAANHPRTQHLTADVWEVDPRTATGGRPVWLLWSSPDCTHFSVAKGGKPRKQKIRSLAEVVVRWARQVHPAVIFLENVQEFAGWGPLDSEGHPIRARMGESFRRWRRKLERAGYAVDHRVLDASLYGAPTRRRRLFLVARRDGLPIRWPEATHGGEKARATRPQLQPLRTAAECIDWDIPCPSIFERKRPLADKTLWRIAQGIRRFVLENPRPFIVEMNHDNRPKDPADPLPTVTTQDNRFNLVTPVVVGVGGRAGQSHPTPGDAPIGAVTAKNDRALVAPHLVEVNHGKREARGQQLGLPLSTVTASRRGTALVAPSLIRTDMHRSNSGCAYSAEDQLRVITSNNGHAVVAAHLATIDQQGTGPGAVTPASAPVPVIVTKNRNALVTALLNKHFGGVVGVPLDGRPLDTVTAVDHHSLTTANLVQIGYGEAPGQAARVNAAEQPLGTVVGAKKHAVSAATLVKLRGQCSGADPGEPMPTVSAQGNHIAEVRAFLTAYYGEDGTGGQDLLEPLRTVTAKHRLGLVTVEGTEYQIVDIGMRMLEPEELLRAQFGRFAESYDLSAARTKEAKVKLIGNSVCPDVAEAVVRANILGEAAGRSVA